MFYICFWKLQFMCSLYRFGSIICTSETHFAAGSRISSATRSSLTGMIASGLREVRMTSLLVPLKLYDLIVWTLEALFQFLLFSPITLSVFSCHSNMECREGAGLENRGVINTCPRAQTSLEPKFYKYICFLSEYQTSGVVVVCNNGLFLTSLITVMNPD